MPYAPEEIVDLGVCVPVIGVLHLGPLREQRVRLVEEDGSTTSSPVWSRHHPRGSSRFADGASIWGQRRLAQTPGAVARRSANLWGKPAPDLSRLRKRPAEPAAPRDPLCDRAAAMKADWGRVALAVSVAGFLVDTAWALSTFVISKPFLPLWPLFVLLVGIFPIHFRTVIGLIRQSGGSVWRPLRNPSLAWLKARVSRSRLVVAAALFVGLWVIGVTALWSLRNGGPDMAHGRFFANSHGSLTPISEATFHHLRLAEQRLFSAVPAAFYLLGVLYNHAVGKTAPVR